MRLRTRASSLYRRRPVPDAPLRAPMLGIEGLEDRARALAASHTLARDPRRGAHDLVSRLNDNARHLRRAYRLIAEDARRGDLIPPAAEWCLDNFHLVEAEIREARRNLPRRYYLELPKLASRGVSGIARIYAMAEEIVRLSDARFDFDRLLRFVVSYQTVAPLTLGEVWAWPSMLKLALLENLRRLADEMLDVRTDREDAEYYFARFEATPPESALPPLPPLRGEVRPAFAAHLLQHIRESGPRSSELGAMLDRKSVV